jgi:flagellar hook-associated protein 3 FlgL
MRIADKMTFDQVNRAITKNRSEISNLQNQAATQKRVTKPSDDPIAAARVLGERVDLRGNEQYVKNLNYAKGFLDFSEQSLSDLGDILVRAKELAISQASDASANPQTRRGVAEEIKQLRNHAIELGNRKLGERYIFGGYNTTQAPFDEHGAYRGDDGELKIHIDKDAFLAMNVPGSFVFEGKGISKDGFTRHPSIQAKTVEELQTQKGERPQEFNPESSGPETRGPASVRISEASAKTVNPEFNGEESSANKLPEGINIFDSLKKLELALMTNDKAGVQDSLDMMDDGLQQVIVARSALGSRVSTIDNSLNAASAHIVDNKQTISQLEDADAFEVISDMNKTESALQAALQTSGKLLQKSLMDFVQI